MFFKILVFVSALLTSVREGTAATDKIICQFASWAGYREGEGSFKPENINASLCTHVYYSFLGVNSDGTLKILDSWNEIDLGGLEHTRELKLKNPKLKVLISIGGYNAGNQLLHSVAASLQLRTNFINSCLLFFQQYGYDGADIDWEYPNDSDRDNFVTLLQEMKEAFEARGYILTVTVVGILRPSYNVLLIAAYSDWINVMTYDFHIPEYLSTGLNSPLFGANSVNESIHEWRAAGAPASKLTLSIPFYGHTYTLDDEEENGLRASATTGISGPYTESPGTLGYNEMCEFYRDWTTVWVEEAQVPYMYSGYNWLSYDNPISAGLKARYAKDNGLAGVAIWSVDTDDFHGYCGEKGSMLVAIKNNLG